MRATRHRGALLGALRVGPCCGSHCTGELASALIGAIMPSACDFVGGDKDRREREQADRYYADRYYDDAPCPAAAGTYYREREYGYDHRGPDRYYRDDGYYEYRSYRSYDGYGGRAHLLRARRYYDAY